MKSKLLSVAALSVLVLSGCSQKNPDIDTTVNEPEVTQNTVTNQQQYQQPSVDQVLAKLRTYLQPVYFGFDKFSISSNMQGAVSRDAQVANHQSGRQFLVKVSGNCDEWGTDEYNMALGLKRANSVKKALVAQGVDGRRIKTVTYGKNNPVCNQKTKECWAKNRRVDVDLVK